MAVAVVISVEAGILLCADATRAGQCGDPRPSGHIQREHGYTSLEEGPPECERPLIGVVDGTLDPAPPVFREDLED